MKQALLIIALSVLTSLCHGQIISDFQRDDTWHICFKDVVKADSLTADQLFIGAKTFFVNAFNSGKDVIQMEDKSAGVIIGKGVTHISNSDGNFGFYNAYRMFMTIKITCKEGRYKYEFYDFVFKTEKISPELPDGIEYSQSYLFDSSNYYNNGVPRPKYERTKLAVFSKVEEIVSKMKHDMAAVRKTKKDEW